jgi:hypothetical protein
VNRLLRVVLIVVALGLAGFPALPAQAGSLPGPHGYILAARDGGVFAFGRAFHGSAAGLPLHAPISGVAATPDGGGYWLVASDGGVFAFGDAHFFGSMGGISLNQPIEGIAATPDGGGYWLVASDGGVFAFGDAGFFGSLSGAHILAPVVGIATTAAGNGYRLLTNGGELFAFGDARVPGGPPAVQAPTGAYVGIARVAGTIRGVVLVTSDGTRAMFDAEATPDCPSAPITAMNAAMVGIAGTASCEVWLTASDGGVFAFGTRFLGSTVRLALAAPIVGIAS